MPGPAVQPVLQLAEDVGEVRDRALFRFKNVNALDPVPELALFPVVEPVARIVSFDQCPEEGRTENCMFSSVRDSENGLIVKSRDSRPTFR